jgi:hypothetical protein
MLVEENVMEIITNDLEKLAGKTIKEIKFFGYDEQLIIKTEDDLYVVFHAVSGYDGDSEVQINDSLDDSEQKNAGLITEEEHKRRIEVRKNECEASNDRSERARWEVLNKKYGK